MVDKKQKLNNTLIIGRIFLGQIGLDMSFKNAKIAWHGKEMPLHPCNCFEDNHVVQKILTNEPCSTAKASTNIIIDDAAAKCEETDLHKSSTEQVHSTDGQCQQPLEVLNKQSRLFQGFDSKQLGIFPNRKHHVDSNLGAKACHIKQPHFVTLEQVKAAKTEMKRQVDLGIVEQCCATEWEMPVFVTPKQMDPVDLLLIFKSQTKLPNQFIITCQKCGMSFTAVKTFFVPQCWMCPCNLTPFHLMRNPKLAV